MKFHPRYTRLVPIHRSTRPPLAPILLGLVLAPPLCFLQPQAMQYSDFSTHLCVACPPPVQGNPSLSHPQGQPGSQEHCRCSYMACSQAPWDQTVVGRDCPAWDLLVPPGLVGPHGSRTQSSKSPVVPRICLSVESNRDTSLSFSLFFLKIYFLK